MKTAILSLPQGWGKTTIAAELSHRLGCTSVVDEWDIATGVTPGALHLVNAPVSSPLPLPDASATCFEPSAPRNSQTFHTLGPWFVDDRAKPFLSVVSGHVAICKVEQQPGDTAAANARLIAAAPALLWELRCAREIIRNALAVMTTEQKCECGRLNEVAGVAGEGVTRANERDAVIAAARGERV